MQKVMIITGGSRGIGAATARLAAQAGYAVCISYVQKADAAETVVNDLRNDGALAIAAACDVAREDDICRLFKEVDAKLGTVTALVNNAGILEQQTRLENMSANRIMRTLQVNILGSLLCAREAVRRMSTCHGGNGGAIVNVSSAASRWGSPNEYVDYAAAKGAIDTFTVGLASEVAAEGIRVNAVRPGLIHTEIHAAGGEPDRVERLKGRVPMQRGGQPEEVAQAILWLLSDAASYTTGAILDVAGGR